MLVSIVDADDLVLKHQAISIHSAVPVLSVPCHFCKKSALFHVVWFNLEKNHRNSQYVSVMWYLVIYPLYPWVPVPLSPFSYTFPQLPIPASFLGIPHGIITASGFTLPHIVPVCYIMAEMDEDMGDSRWIRSSFCTGVKYLVAIWMFYVLWVLNWVIRIIL